MHSESICCTPGGVRLLRCPAVRVVGLPIALLMRLLLMRRLLLCHVSPVVGLLRVAAVPVRTGISRREVVAGPTALVRRRVVSRVIRHVATGSFYEFFSRFRHFNNEGLALQRARMD